MASLCQSRARVCGWSYRVAMTRAGGGPDAPSFDAAAIQDAIDVLETQRDVLGAVVVDTALAPLREQLAAAQARSTGEQRKLVTVLFADLVDFTVLSRRLDAEDTRDVLDAYFAAWRTAIEAAGGVVEKFIGDAVMAVFGLHRSQEDDARQAVRCALTMRTELGRLNESVEQRFGITLQMRVGIDTGDVVVSALGERGGQEFVAVGPTVNRAARLEAAAPAGGLLVSAQTYRHARGWFSVEPVPGLALKGLDEPTDAYLVVSERPHGFQLDRTRGVEGVETATIGRDGELRALQDRLGDVVEDRRWQVVTIVGDAGVGKSRLLLDFDHWLGERGEDTWWFRGRASHQGRNLANALLRDLMATRLGIAESDPRDVVRAKCEKGFQLAFGDGPDGRRAALLIGLWLGFDLDVDPGVPGIPREPQALRDQATARLAEYFARLSEQATVVILLEDLHWADDGSIRWLDAADRVLHDKPVLVVSTARPTLFEDRPHWSEGLEHHARLDLRPLSRRESRALVGELLQHVDEVPEPLVSLLTESSEGNPFYLEELVTWLLDAGVVVRGADRWRVVEERLDTLTVPSTLKGVLQARIDGLSADERAVLQRASVVGRVFWDDAVVHLQDRRAPTDTTPELLASLRHKEIVFEREVSAFESTHEFLFKHALLRDVAYDGVLKARRAVYHSLAARWLVEVVERSHRGDEFAALVAEHFDRAGDDAAASWYLRAGRQAASVHALAEATRLLGRGLDVAPPAERELRFDLLAEREEVRHRRGDRESEAADLAAMDALVADDDVPRRVVLVLAKARYAFVRSEYEVAVGLAREGARLAEPAGLADQAAAAFLWCGRALTWHADVDEAREALQGALDRSRAVGRLDLVGESLRYLSMLANNRGDYREALRLAQEALDVLEQDGDTEAQATALAHFATIYHTLGRYDEARHCLEQTLPIFRMSGHRYREAVAVGNLATIAYSQGRLADALGYATEAVTIVHELDDQETIANNYIVLGQINLTLGRLPDAEAHLQRALEIGDRLQAHPLRADALFRLAYAALARQAPTDAVRLAERAVAAGDDAPGALEHAEACLALAYALVATGEVEAAERAVCQAAADFTALDLPARVREVGAVAAALAAHRGDLRAALEQLEPLLAHLDPAGLQEWARPAVTLRACRDVLVRAQDPRADQVRQAARDYVTVRAELTGDPALAEEYLAVPDNAALLEAALLDAAPGATAERQR